MGWGCYVWEAVTPPETWTRRSRQGEILIEFFTHACMCVCVSCMWVYETISLM